jgi:methanogenic corrinoid protein MtbC1/DNA-binding XRE family transcriptional regulator
MKLGTRRFSARYLRTLLAGDGDAATQTVTDALAHGLRPEVIYEAVLFPALVRIGHMWAARRLSVADEHLGSAITSGQMERLRPLFRPARRLGLLAVIAAVAGEHHWIGARAVADFLYADGWDVMGLGANVPDKDLLAFVERKRPSLVGLSVTMEDGLRHLAVVIRRVRRARLPLKVLVGGAALDQRRARRANADAFAPTASAGRRVARELVEDQDGETKSLGLYLKALGKRVELLRRGRRWSVNYLADVARLDRGYVSAIERGRQNVSLSVVMRLAVALGEPIDALLTVGRRPSSGARRPGPRPGRKRG